MTARGRRPGRGGGYRTRSVNRQAARARSACAAALRRSQPTAQTTSESRPRLLPVRRLARRLPGGAVFERDGLELKGRVVGGARRLVVGTARHLRWFGTRRPL